ncbi:MAG: aspartate--tRNA ligase [Clostridia bacterium]|nr:aspartate--tRNA ligase [Clostridia bacterium]
MPFLKEDKRTHYATELSECDIGKKVTVNGWCARQRDLGSLIFIDLRDRSGIIQIAFDENTDRDVFGVASDVRSEYVLTVTGTVRSRGADVNKSRATGAIEIYAEKIKILCTAETTPFEINDDVNVRGDLRMQFRYLDLRRPSVTENIITRSKITSLALDYYAKNGFLYIETPCLIRPTPEGARDYLVPSRIANGKFYALPQSPQLYKQLLMYAGFDRYVQLARCFRDEDLRADRQPEFTQLDLEMSFMDEDDIMTVNEEFVAKLFHEMLGVEIKTPLPRMTWREAMERFGSDKPDLRFDFELVNLTDILKDCAFRVFAGAISGGGSVRAINVKGGAKFSRKEIDSLTEFAKSYRAKGVAWLKSSGGERSSSYAKFLTDEENAKIEEAVGFEDGDLVLIVADRNSVVFDTLGALRRECARRLGLLDPHEFKMLWVTEFPLFELDEETGAYKPMHHPFTAPMEEDLPLLDTDTGAVRSRAYDIVINGTEIGGGSIRISTPEMQTLMFSKLGIGKEEANAKFGFLMEALKYGIPPHGGMAFGLDRLVAEIVGTEDIRDVIAFPKAQNASEPMSKAPSDPDPKALLELGLKLDVKEEDK